MSGKTHQVYTCVNFSSLAHKLKPLSIVRLLLHQTLVSFELSDEEIESYTNTAEPYDKAGSYAVPEVEASNCDQRNQGISYQRHGLTFGQDHC